MENYAEIFGNKFRQYYAEVSDDYGEKTPDYVEHCKINKVVPLSFLTYKIQELQSFISCLTFCCRSWEDISSFNAVFYSLHC